MHLQVVGDIHMYRPYKQSDAQVFIFVMDDIRGAGGPSIEESLDFNDVLDELLHEARARDMLLCWGGWLGDDL